MRCREEFRAADVLRTTGDGRDLSVVWDELQTALDIHNQARDSLVALISAHVTVPAQDVAQGLNGDFEEASEYRIVTRRRARG